MQVTLHRRAFVSKAMVRAACGIGLIASSVHAQQNPPADPTSPATPAPPTIAFIDIPKFDRDLHQALSGKAEPVNVSFYERVSPNSMPERLQKWISAVEKTGGKVDVEPPPNEPVPKSPLFLIGLIGSLWSAIKALTEIKEEAVYLSAAKRNVLIVLDRDATRQVVVARVTFSPRTP